MRASFRIIAASIALVGHVSAYSAYAGCIIPSGIPAGFVGAAMSGSGIVDPTGVDCAASFPLYLPSY